MVEPLSKQALSILKNVVIKIANNDVTYGKDGDIKIVIPSKMVTDQQSKSAYNEMKRCSEEIMCLFINTQYPKINNEGNQVFKRNTFQFSNTQSNICTDLSVNKNGENELNIKIATEILYFLKFGLTGLYSIDLFSNDKGPIHMASIKFANNQIQVEGKM